jgi:hypothetical protein
MEKNYGRLVVDLISCVLNGQSYSEIHNRLRVRKTSQKFKLRDFWETFLFLVCAKQEKPFQIFF